MQRGATGSTGNRVTVLNQHAALCQQSAGDHLVAGDEPIRGKPEGWAAGIIYALANRDRRACGVPGMLNAELEEFFGVTMSTVYKRAAQVERALEI